MELFEYIDTLDTPYDIFYTDSDMSALHWHYYCEILYIRSGRIRLVCGQHSEILEPGDLCYIYPMQLHEVQSVRDGSVDYAVIKFDVHTIHIPKAYVQRMYDYFVHRDPNGAPFLLVRQAGQRSAGLDALIHGTVQEATEQDALFALQIQANIYSILISIARLCPDPQPVQDHPSGGNTLSFFHILEYIDTHSAENIEVQQLAEKCHLSYSHFARLFRENYGRSCSEYIHYIRLNKAEELLLHSDYDISYIACETGFFDSSHFIRAYKKWKGITPRQQRAKKAAYSLPTR